MQSENCVPCEVSPKKSIGLLPCSGACNVGMLTTKCVVRMAQAHDDINFVCSLGIPIGIEGIVNNAKKSDHYIAINGCKVGCSTKALQSINITPDQEIIVTEDLNIQKNKNYMDDTGLDALVLKADEAIKAYQ